MSGWTGQYHGKALWSTVGHGYESRESMACTKTKMKLFGNGCEKAKHHLISERRQAKNVAFATLPDAAARAPLKP